MKILIYCLASFTGLLFLSMDFDPQPKKVTPVPVEIVRETIIDVTVAGHALPVIEDAVYGDVRLVYGMARLAKTEHVTLDRLSKRYRWQVSNLIDIAQRHSTHRISAELLIAIAWRESRWDPHAVGDGGNSCGITQIRTDFDRRPPCDELLEPSNAIAWTARELEHHARRCNGYVCLSRYNGSGKGAIDYEVWAWRTVARLTN